MASKPTFERVAYAVYVLSMNFNGRCLYCGIDLRGSSPEVKMEHYKNKHEEAGDGE